MNTASATGTVWMVGMVVLSIISFTGLTVLGIRRCLWSVITSGARSWRAAGFLVGVGLLGLAVVVLGLWLSDAVARAGLVVLLAVAAVALVLWSWCMWTDRAPVGEWIPGRYVSSPHRSAWLIGVYLVLATWGLALWLTTPPADPAQSPVGPEPMEILVVSAVTLVGGGLLVGWAQSTIRRRCSRAIASAGGLSPARCG